MLGYSTSEVDTLERFVNNPVNVLCTKTVFTEIVIGVAKCIYSDKECLNRVTKCMQKLSGDLSRVKIVEIGGGPKIGFNRYETISKGLQFNNSTKYEEMQQAMCMFMDIDDDFINPKYWSDIRSCLSDSSIDVLEINFISDKFDMIRPEDSVKDTKRFINLDPWNPNNYDPITGYYYYNPKLRTSSTNKIFKLMLLDFDILKSWDRYEDSLIYADMYSKIKSVTIAPFAGILYNRSSSSVLTSDAKSDEMLEKLQKECCNKKYLSEGSPVPYLLLHDQIQSWRTRKKEE